MAPISCLFLFYFCFSLFFLPSSSIVTIHTLHQLAFSPSLHYFFSKKNHFPKLLSLLSFISLNIFSDLCVLDHFCHKPIFETHLQTSIFFALTMESSNGPSFLTFNGKKYHPSLEWNDGEGLLQDLCSTLQ